MADNVAITAGTGTTIAADDIGAGVLVQRVKPVWGPDGTGNDTDVASGKPLPVQLRASTGQTLSDTSGILISSTQLAALGQQTMANSQGVTIASDQTAVAVKAAASAWADGADVTFGTKTDAKSVNTDATSTSAMSVLKQISASVQAPPSQAVTNAGTFAVQSAVAGDVASGSADSGNPVKQGFKATTSLSGLTLAADANRINGFAGVDGVQITRPHSNLEDIVTNSTACTSGANTSIITAQGSGIKFYLLSVILYNNGASNGSCIITDGSGGTTKLKLPFPASTGTVYSPPIPIPFTANTAVFADPTGSDTIDVTIIGFKSKI